MSTLGIFGLMNNFRSSTSGIEKEVLKTEPCLKQNLRFTSDVYKGSEKTVQDWTINRLNTVIIVGSVARLMNEAELHHLFC